MVLAVFGQTAWFPFINYDDSQYVYNNPVVQKGLTWQGLAWAATFGEIGHWHPLTWVSHMADCQLYGLWAGGHHLTNVLLHGAAAVLLFLGLRRLTGKHWRSFCVAAVFAIHPLRVESVAWVAERKDVLSGVFFMLTLLAYARYAAGCRAGNGPPAFFSRAGMGPVALVFGLGLMSKNTLVTLPFLLLVLDWWPLRRWRPAGDPGQGESWSSLVMEKLPLLLLAAGSCVATALVPEKVPDGHLLPFGLRAANALVTYVIYLRQFFFPAGLANPYPYPSYGASYVQAGLALGLLGGLTVGAYLVRKSRPYLLAGWLWYLGMLVPAIGLVQISYYSHADRYTYLPEIGVASALIWGVAEGYAGGRRRQMVLGVLMALVTGGLMTGAAIQTTYWRSNEIFWRRDLTCTSGNSLACFHMANLEVEQGRLAAAVELYDKMLKLTPDYPQGWLNLGQALLNEGATNEAAASFKRALEYKPEYAEAHYDLGNIWFDQARFSEAADQYEKAVAADPGFYDARFNLGNTWLGMEDWAAAIAQYRALLQLKPDYAGAWNNLGTALMQAGRAAEAEAAYHQLLTSQPDNVDALNNLAWLLATSPQASLRNGTEALQLAHQAVALTKGGQPLGLRALAAAEAETGQFAAAGETARQAGQLAQAQGDAGLVEQLALERVLYEAGKPVRETRP